MTRELFGTDGIRGTANRHPVTAETAMAVAMAAVVTGLGGDDPSCGELDLQHDRRPGGL